MIYRNTPQWFIAMDKPIMTKMTRTPFARGQSGDLDRAMGAAVGSEPHQRHGQLEAGLVISRQRAWGVPIAVFVKENSDGSVEILQDDHVNQRIVETFSEAGADAWYMDGARERFLGERAGEPWKKVDDICDVWFDSGSTTRSCSKTASTFRASARSCARSTAAPTP